MAEGFPERRHNDEALIDFIVDSLNRGDIDGLKSQFKLSDRSVEILDRRLRGLQTYQAIGDALHLTKERIRQILLESYASFRHPERRMVWDCDYGLAKGHAGLDPSSGAPLDKTLLSSSARNALYRLGIRHISDLVGKTRRELRSHRIGRTTFAEIEREMAEYGLAFRRTTGPRGNETICGTTGDETPTR
jgi:hypothetical protein